MSMSWKVKNDIDTYPFNQDRYAVGGGGVLISELKKLSIAWKVVLSKALWIGNGLDIQVWTQLVC